MQIFVSSPMLIIPLLIILLECCSCPVRAGSMWLRTLPWCHQGRLLAQWTLTCGVLPDLLPHCKIRQPVAGSGWSSLLPSGVRGSCPSVPLPLSMLQRWLSLVEPGTVLTGQMMAMVPPAKGCLHPDGCLGGLSS